MTSCHKILIGLRFLYKLVMTLGVIVLTWVFQVCCIKINSVDHLKYGSCIAMVTFHPLTVCLWALLSIQILDGVSIHTYVHNKGFLISQQESVGATFVLSTRIVWQVELVVYYK